MMRRSLGFVLALAIVTVGCGGPQVLTEKRMLEWGPMLNLYMGTNMEGGNSYPETLDELPPELSGGSRKKRRVGQSAALSAPAGRQIQSDFGGPRR